MDISAWERWALGGAQEHNPACAWSIHLSHTRKSYLPSWEEMKDDHQNSMGSFLSSLSTMMQNSCIIISETGFPDSQFFCYLYKTPKIIDDQCIDIWRWVDLHLYESLDFTCQLWQKSEKMITNTGLCKGLVSILLHRTFLMHSRKRRRYIAFIWFS